MSERQPTLADLGECEAIRRLAARLHPVEANRAGLIDDAAVCHGPGMDCDLVMTSDPVIEGVHFDHSVAPRAIGHKAVGRVLSDLAAMGATPLWLQIDVVAPGKRPMAELEAIYDGADALAQRHGAGIVGGDLADGPVLELHVFGVGTVPVGTAVLRSGAQVGDRLYVSGQLGGSRKGRHAAFDPRVAEGGWLRENGWARSMMDISDGVLKDLGRLVQASGVGAELTAAHIPVSSAASEMADGQAPLEHALSDGEDFELLWSIDRNRQAAFEQAWADAFELSCCCIGTIVPAEQGVVLVDTAGNRQVISADGYEHFRTENT
jgi:thiamine-monophosphate kinase